MTWASGDSLSPSKLNNQAVSNLSVMNAFMAVGTSIFTGSTGTYAAPSIDLYKGNAGTDAKVWSLLPRSAGSLSLRAVNDANTAGNTLVDFERSGYTGLQVKVFVPLSLQSFVGTIPSAASGLGYLYVDSTSSLYFVNGSGVSTLVA